MLLEAFIFLLSLRLYRANRKKARFIKVIIFIIFFLVLFFINTLFSSFEKMINSSDFSQPLFVVSKDGNGLNIQENSSLRKVCLKNNIKSQLENSLSDEFDVKEGFIFATYFTEIGSDHRNNTLVEFRDLSSINSSCLKKLDDNKNRQRAVPIYVNNSFCNIFDLKSDYLVYLNDFFGDFTITRMRAESSVVAAGGGKVRPSCYVDIENIKPFLSIPEDLSLPLFLYYKDDVNIFSPEYLIIKHNLEENIKDLGLTIQPFYSIDKDSYDIFNFYLRTLCIIVIVVILILIYAMSVSYYINFNTRKRDFALFRSFGLTNKKLFWVMFLENFYTCFMAFSVSVILNFLIGFFVKPLSIGTYIFSFKMSWPGIITLIIILIATSFLSIIKSYRHIIKGSDISALLEGK